MVQTPKRPRDPNQLAKAIVDIATGEATGDNASESPETARARKAGKSGGTARAAVLTPEQRSKIAHVAASARWKKS